MVQPGLSVFIFMYIEGVKVIGDDSFIADINFQEMFGASAIILIVVGLVIACIAFIGWCSNCCGGYNVIRILVSIYVYMFV